jgi:hypothetical protein
MYPTGAVRRPILGKCGKLTGSTQGFDVFQIAEPAAVHARNKSKTKGNKSQTLARRRKILRDYIPFSRKVVSRIAKIDQKTPCVNAEDANMPCMRCRLLKS